MSDGRFPSLATLISGTSDESLGGDDKLIHYVEITSQNLNVKYVEVSGV